MWWPIEKSRIFCLCCDATSTKKESKENHFPLFFVGTQHACVHTDNCTWNNYSTLEHGDVFWRAFTGLTELNHLIASKCGVVNHPQMSSDKSSVLSWKLHRELFC